MHEKHLRTLLPIKVITPMNQTPRKVKVSKKAPKNDAALKSLKEQGYHVKIEHFRRKKTGALVPDKELRVFSTYIFDENTYERVASEKGGATKMILVKDNNEIEIISTCYWKDRFCRKHGVKACLDKLEKDHNIKA